MRSTTVAASVLAILAMGALGACATPQGATPRPAAPQASAGGRIEAMEQSALARQRATVIPANGMLPIDDVIGLTVLDVKVVKSFGPQDGLIAADDGQDLVVISYKLTNVTPQGQPVPDGQRLLLVDPRGQTYQADADRTAKLLAGCGECAKAGGQVAPDAPSKAVAVFQLPAGIFNARTWLASWREEDAEKIRFPGPKAVAS